MENFGALEWGLVIAGLAVAFFAITRVTTPDKREGPFDHQGVDKTDTPSPDERSPRERIAEGMTLQAGTIILTQGVNDEVDRYIRAGQTIRAIKLVRDHSSARLKEAKDYVDARARELR